MVEPDGRPSPSPPSLAVVAVFLFLGLDVHSLSFGIARAMAQLLFTGVVGTHTNLTLLLARILTSHACSLTLSRTVQQDERRIDEDGRWHC
jgi:uncharacterized membrane protein